MKTMRRRFPEVHLTGRIVTHVPRRGATGGTHGRTRVIGR